MIFTVSENFEGSCVLTTLKKAIWKGMTVSIYGNDLYAPDIKMAIKRGILVPADKNFDEKQLNYSPNVTIVNKTDRVLVLGNIIMKAGASRIIDKDVANTTPIISAEKNGFIRIVSDEPPASKKKKVKKAKKTTAKKKVSKKKTSKKKVKKNVETIDPEEHIPAYSSPETGAEREVKAKVWNFREQESEEAQVVPTTPDMINVDVEETEGIEFVDESVEAQQITPKKKKAKRKTKKKEARKTIKKKGKATKKQKVKTIGPADVAVELDSNGRPLTIDNTLQHLIDSLGEPEDVTFVDGEQAQERYENRTDMD